jgi:hypothetical protein
MYKINPDYIIGLVDGEGSFTIYIRDPKLPRTVKRRVTVEPKFYIKLIEKDKEILERLKTYFACGSIYFQKDDRPNHQHCYRYEVYNREDLLKTIIPFFKKHPLQFVSKRNDFELFCQMMEMIDRKEHLKVEGLEKLFQLKQRMH